MSAADWTLAFQVPILILISGIVWSNWRTTKNIAQTTNLIRDYRREINWLTKRLDSLEAKEKQSKL
jgi:hypothetical protein